MTKAAKAVQEATVETPADPHHDENVRYLEKLHLDIAITAMNGILASGCDRGAVPIANMSFDMATAMIENAFKVQITKSPGVK